MSKSMKMSAPSNMEFLEPEKVLDATGLAVKLESGSPVLLPTDTLPALAACPVFANQLWQLKQRPFEKPLILMGQQPNQLFECVLPNALDDAIFLARRYWPGPLTMILPASGTIVDALHPGGKNIGLRVPKCDLTLDLLAKTGPLATTSANLAGHTSSLNEFEAANYFPGLSLLGPLPWADCSGLASTVILWERKGCWKVVRKGAVTLERTLE